jgi:uncharacterized circularly permuted ATP-grasp superfamily protein/uncharacterized alpha-E superfamily protein
VTDPGLAPPQGLDGVSAVEVWDEMAGGQGRLRAHWTPLMREMSPVDPDRMAERGDEARRLIRQNGVTYNVYGDPLGLERPWPLDLMPLVLSAEEWADLAAGACQRARLLNGVLADLYGPQTLIDAGLVPAPAVFGDPGYLRACRHAPVPRGLWLHLVGFDLGRGPDGVWRVLSDRTQAPSGTGYALENRLVVGRVLREAVRGVGVQPLGPFFQALRDALEALARPDPGEEPRFVLLSPGPYNETYFEHAYLARHLGIPLVEGADLTVRRGTLYLKTIEGLARVHVVLRRLDDDFCDPLELRPDSALGVPGLTAAARTGRVAIANALGTGLLESAAIKQALPGLAERLLGEPLRLPQAEQWWCGTRAGLDRALGDLRRLVLRPAFAADRTSPLVVADLTAVERTRLEADLRADPRRFVAEMPATLSTAPVWIDGRLQPRAIVLRIYVAGSPGPDGINWRAMPGGLTRFAPETGRPLVSMQRGSGSKDTWIPGSGPQADTRPARARGGLGGALPSRLADGLFWLGRYAERADNTLSLLRGVAVRMVDVERPGGDSELLLLRRLMAWQNLWPAELSTLPDVHGRHLAKAVHAALHEPSLPDGVRATLQRLARCASAVRDRLAPDLWRVISDLEQASGVRTRVSPSALLERIESLVLGQAALVGLEEETILRGPAWRFLRLGRWLERAQHLLALVQWLARAAEDTNTDPVVLDLLLELGESASGYRERFAAAPERGPALAHLLVDESNPRSLAFQLAEIARALAQLPPGGPSADEAAARIADLREDLGRTVPTALDGDFAEALNPLAVSVRRLSELLTQAYFSPAAVGQAV